MRERSAAGFTLLELLLVILLLALAAGWVAPALLDRISRAREQQAVGEALSALEQFCLRCQRWNRPGSIRFDQDKGLVCRMEGEEETALGRLKGTLQPEELRVNALGLVQPAMLLLTSPLTGRWQIDRRGRGVRVAP